MQWFAAGHCSQYLSGELIMLELKLYEIATGDSITKEGYDLLRSKGYVENPTKAPDGKLFAKLTPKGDKLVRKAITG